MFCSNKNVNHLVCSEMLLVVVDDDEKAFNFLDSRVEDDAF